MEETVAVNDMMDSPSIDETPPVSDQEGEVQATEGDGSEVAAESQQTDETLPFGQHPRWQKMVSANREYKAKVQELERQAQEYAGARDLHEILKENPDKARAVFDLLHGKQPEVREDPYAQYEPDVAAKFRKLDELERWKAEFERKEESRTVEQIQRNKEYLEDEFANKLVADGLIDKEGNHSDEAMVKAAENLTRSALMEIARDPKMPTKAELDQAYGMFKSFISSAEKRGLKKAVTPTAPPTGSKTGSAPRSDKQETDAERIARMAAEWSGGA